MDERNLTSLRENLRTDISKRFSDNCEPPKASDIWVTTFPICKKDIKTANSNIDLLTHWPGYTQAYGYFLIKSDFKSLYPNSENSLYPKWETFSVRILEFFNGNIKVRVSREELACCKQISNIDSVNYMIVKLLNSVIKPTTRFKSQYGKVCKKFDISDAQESFTACYQLKRL
ncbi:uncharacterized protein LOC142240352 [Haematobia irritans]|uniref:uncharacterized protein LOC142240352 n=1 Tax=Haematobia irritans TaxID=7368 RepID=UPI003F500893